MDSAKPPFTIPNTPPAGKTWFTEYHSPQTGFTIQVRRTYFEEQSPFQRVRIIGTADYGRMLILDGAVQTTERDEFIYHEMLVHPALFIHRRPRRVLIVGGGDGGCLREVLRHPSVEEAVLCEIDGMVVEACRKHLPSIAAGALGDERATVLIEDGVKYVKKNKRAFDVILVDSTDPVNMASPLTRLSFFRAAREALRPGGVYATQSQGPIFEGKGLRRISRTIRKAFRGVDYYLAGVPTYPGGVWSFAIAAPEGPSPAKRPPRPVPKKMKMHYYSRELHRTLFGLPAFVQELIR